MEKIPTDGPREGLTNRPTNSETIGLVDGHKDRRFRVSICQKRMGRSGNSVIKYRQGLSRHTKTQPLQKADRQMDKWRDRQALRQQTDTVGRHSYSTQTDGQMERQTDAQTADRQTDRWTGR